MFYNQGPRFLPTRGAIAVYRLIRCSLTCLFFATHAVAWSHAQEEPLRQPESLSEQLLAADPAYLAQQAELRGDARRGGLVFYKSAAACAICHSSDQTASPLGPKLTALPRDVPYAYVVEAILRPSQTIAKGFETVRLVTTDGTVHTGLRVDQNEQRWVLRDAANLQADLTIDADDIEEVSIAKESMMPAGLAATFPDQAAFLDLVAYVVAVARGGSQAATELKPTEEQLAITDDSSNLDHGGILKRLRQRDYDAGSAIYGGYCVDCHGPDGNQPSLPTARAFGTQNMRFGADPYRMFLTLTKGNGLMAPMTHLSPKERYQVIHYIREAFMRPTNPAYQPLDDDYLSSLPTGTDDGQRVVTVARDFGPALASQLRRDFPSVLSIQLGKQHTIAYDTHTMDQADLWAGGFVDHQQTQHSRDRGEGTVNPAGDSVDGLAGWQWGHDGQMDYSRADCLPRGPLPRRWLDYRGHYLHGQRVVLHYQIDGRPIWESPASDSIHSNSVRHTMRIGPGKALLLSVASIPSANRRGVLLPDQSLQGQGNATDTAVLAGEWQQNAWQSLTTAYVVGDTDGMSWESRDGGRLVLRLPADSKPRLIAVVRAAAASAADSAKLLGLQQDRLASGSPQAASTDPLQWTSGGPPLWPDVLTTTGTLGLERDAYALDTITIPQKTPWNTWFRTSAIDFFSDGRMAVATYGGDVWIVSGVDDTLQALQWKRFAGGLYEPMGLRIVDDVIYVTCKDRITRLHDTNGDQAADFYENFSADTDVSVNFHAFNFDLQSDAAGNFYYAKAGHGADFALPGAIIQVSPDGRQQSIYCTGFRSPNGMGILPDGRLTVSDNQGQWMPASKINILRRGGFYGWVPTYGYPGKWVPDGGQLDLTTVVAPESFDQPVVWMPQEFDNSSGGQVWADDARFGPLSGHLLHTSFGKGWMSYLLLQEFADVQQAAIVKLPFDFQTGIMRARVHPIDGQIYATGLQGWNGGGRAGLRDNGIQRLRYTGKPGWMITQASTVDDELRLRFSQPVDPASAVQESSYTLQAWDYRWQASYGSKRYSPTTGEVGVDKWKVAAATVDADHLGIRLKVPRLEPANQLRLVLRLQSPSGEPLIEEMYWTIHAIPSSSPQP